jgi:cytochrome c oxidase cbb3-type subunit 3
MRGEAVHLADAGFMKSASDGFLKHAIVAGRPGTKMLPFATTVKETDIDDVVAYLRTMAKQPVPNARLPEPTGHEAIVLNPHGANPTFTIKDERFVSVAQVHEALLAHRRMAIIDARPPSEWAQVHITGAVSIPYYQLLRLAEIPADVTAVAYCACPHHLSGEVVEALRKRGHAAAFILDEGINDWHRHGYPVVAAPGVKPPPAEPTPVPPTPVPAAPVAPPKH